MTDRRDAALQELPRAHSGPGGDAESARVIGGTRSLHFQPGTRYFQPSISGAS